MRKKPEILAPAGSLVGLKAAVAAGCDAVYIGGKQFGARAYAENPDCDEMLEAIAYCHLHNVKIYMTVNTLLKEKELNDSLFAYLKPYYEAGLDAVIVQDVGVMHFISEHFPSLDIHASTQMTLTQAKATELFRKYHVNRIVPARELSINELCQMRKDTDMELEVFVHGALCYCYSGQCLFSSMQGGRSGNRGRCAQPCRMPYFVDGNRNKEGDYLLSPKELCNLIYLPEMIEAGIDSFKIEGRMKRPEYTAFVTSIYRKYVDLYMALGGKEYQKYLEKHKGEWNEDLRQLAELYNRNGFTQGYLEGKIGLSGSQRAGEKSNMLAQMRPKHGGVCVGEVISVGKHEVIYRSVENISAQDVVEFRDKYQRPTYEYTLGNDVKRGQKVSARYQKGSKIFVGDKVYRTKDAALLESIRNKYIDVKMQMPIQGRLVAVLGKEIELHLQKDDFCITCFGDICEQAQNQQATIASVEKAIKQTGESLFYFECLEVLLDENIFLPIGALKKLRRQALEELKCKITESYRRYDTVSAKMLKQSKTENIGLAKQLQTFNKQKLTASISNMEQLEAVLAFENVTGVYVQTEQMDSQSIEKAYQSIVKSQKEAYLVMPVIFRDSIWKRFEADLACDTGILSLDWNAYLVKNFESVYFLKNVAQIAAEKIRLDHNMYVMNREAVNFWEEQGIMQYTLSLELTEREIEQLDFLSKSEILIYGKIPLMVSAQCICANTEGCMVGNVEKQNQQILMQDQKDRQFVAVNYCKYCYNIIYQKEPLDIIQSVQKNEKLSVSSLRYVFTTESGEDVSLVLGGLIREKTQTGHFELGIE